PTCWSRSCSGGTGSAGAAPSASRPCAPSRTWPIRRCCRGSSASSASGRSRWWPSRSGGWPIACSPPTTLRRAGREIARQPDPGHLPGPHPGERHAVSESARPGALSAIDRLVVSLVAGINMRALYSGEHPALASHVERILEAVIAACEDQRKEALTFLVVGQDLVVESQPLRTGSLYHQQLIRALGRRGVERLTLGRGLDAEEVVRFLTPMARGG